MTYDVAARAKLTGETVTLCVSVALPRERAEGLLSDLPEHPALDPIRDALESCLSDEDAPGSCRRPMLPAVHAVR